VRLSRAVMIAVVEKVGHGRFKIRSAPSEVCSANSRLAVPAARPCWCRTFRRRIYGWGVAAGATGVRLALKNLKTPGVRQRCAANCAQEFQSHIQKFAATVKA
jgi:hypothetical protein